MFRSGFAVAACTAFLSLPLPAAAAVIDVVVPGAAPIFLAGRTDLTIPPASDPWPGGMLRHPGPTPEEAQETIPPSVAVIGGTKVRVVAPATGGVNYYQGFGPGFFGPDGSAAGTTALNGFGGISGIAADRVGMLVGVFLGNDVPSDSGLRPAALSFFGAAKDYLTIAPELGQVFFVGDGQTAGGVLQKFLAPAGATRLFFGIADGWDFKFDPGYYDDNDGSFRITVATVPVPAALPLLLLALGGLAVAGRRRA